MRRSSGIVSLLISALWLSSYAFSESATGLIVEVVVKGSAAAKVGVKVGDRLLSYAGRPLPSIAALQAAQQNTFDKKEVALRIRHGEETLTLTVPLGKLGVGVRPELPPEALTLYDEGKSAQKTKKIEEILTKWTAAARAAQDAGDKPAAAWLHGRVGAIYEGQRQWKEARAAYEKAWLLLKDGEDAAGQSRTLSALGWCSRKFNDFPAAQRWYEQARQTDAAAGNQRWETDNLNRLGIVAARRGKLDEAHDYFSRALTIRERLAPGSPIVAGSLNNLANIAQERGKLDEARNYYSRALGIYEHLSPNSLDIANCLNNLGNVEAESGKLTTAHDYYTRALAIKERLAPNSRAVADTLNNLGTLAQERGKLDKAHDYFSQALAIVERLAPKSLYVAVILDNLGLVARHRDKLDEAHDYHSRALAIRERLAPNSLAVAASLNGLGSVAHNRGDLDAAHDYHSRALAIKERLAPNSLDVARSLGNLGNVAHERGDLEGAHDYFTRALAIQGRLAPGSMVVAISHNNLGNIAADRGDLDAAQDYYTRALEIFKRLAPDSLTIADCLNNLGTLAEERGELKTARDYYTRSLAIKERLAPNSLDVATNFNNLGNVARASGNLDEARDYYTNSLAIKERLAPNSLDVASSLSNLGVVAHDRDELDAARDYYTRSLAICERLAPNSLTTANSLNNLGHLALGESRFSDALEHFTRAVDIVEAQRSQIASTEVRALLVALHTLPYTGLLRTYLALHDLPAAFTTVERARARSLVDMLSERAVDLSADAPTELVKEQDNLHWKRSVAYKQLTKLDPNKDSDRIETLRAELTRYAVQQRQLEAQIRHASPKFAALQYPKPLGLKGAQAALDKGTLLLTYYVDNKETYLFAIRNLQGGHGNTGEQKHGGRGNGLQVFRVKAKARDLRARVKAFRAELAEKKDVKQQGKELYHLLVRPAQRAIEQAERVLICPDGALNMLPFAALIVDEGNEKQRQASGTKGNGDGVRYFADLKPLHRIVSMTVYAEIRRHPPKPDSESLTSLGLLAFGDPKYSGADGSAKVRGLNLVRLPWTRKEVEAIAKLYGKQARTLLGKEATETAAKQRSGTARLLHFACHGLLDNRDPLRSGLVLSPTEGEGGDDGLLQAWEIFEKLRLDADLVVLSACDTALGEMTKNEGIIGLTRALQYAGARSVVASLWRVSDESTAILMEAFYRELQQGATKDVALQRAMAAVRKSPKRRPLKGHRGFTKDRVPSADYTHPYHWAAFVLIGAWR